MSTKITLRKASISGERYSLFLDFYPAIRNPKTMKMVYKETLGIYVFQNPKNDIEKEYNKEMYSKAEAIRAIRIQSCINEEFGFLDKNQQKEDFLQFFFDLSLKKDQKWAKVYIHFRNFVGDRCTFGDVTVDLCRRFRDYLMNVNQLKNTEKKLKRNSQAGYFSTFMACLKVAYRERLIKENVNDFLEKISWEETKREFLTLDELCKLVETPCDIPVLKRASLFSCLTGLRFSDVLQLRWGHIEKATVGGYWMRIRTEKTETEATLPLSPEALRLCGSPEDGLVFKDFCKSMVSEPLKKWIKSAGIHKHITFHSFRHTFATLQLALGTDIYTVKEMLTHKFISTTEIYGHIVNQKKVDSANKIHIDFKQLEKHLFN